MSNTAYMSMFIAMLALAAFVELATKSEPTIFTRVVAYTIMPGLLTSIVFLVTLP